MDCGVWVYEMRFMGGCGVGYVWVGWGGRYGWVGCAGYGRADLGGYGDLGG
jgi:hypothetical protein